MNAMQQAQESKQKALEENSVFQIELLSETVDDTCTDLFADDFPSLYDFDDVYSCDVCTDTKICSICAEIEVALQSDILTTDEVANEVVHVDETLETPAARNKPSIEQPPFRELKPIPQKLKYPYLEMNEKLLFIISSKFYFDHESKFLQVLKKHKKGIGWTLDDIYDISSSMCVHRISLEDASKVVRQPHNLWFLDVVKDESTFTYTFDTFTFRRLFFDPGIKGEGTKINFKVNVHRIRLFRESPTLEGEIVKEASLAKVVYAITYPP